MQLSIIESVCGGSQLLVTQDQGDNSAVVINFPYDITGVTFKGTISFPVPIVVEIGSGIVVIDASIGKIKMQLTSAQTQNVVPGQYAFDLWSTTPGSPDVNTDPLTGFFEINEAITKIS